MPTSRPNSRAGSSRVSTPEAKGKDTSEQPEAPELPELHLASQSGDTERIHQLIHAQGADPNARDLQNITPLHWAAINNRLLACKELLLAGATVDATGGELQASPLQWAARNGHVDVCHLLICHGADPSLKDFQGFNVLHLAVHSSNPFLVLYVLSQQLPIAIDEADAAGRSALAWAAYQGDGISVDILLRFGADANRTDPEGLTPLHWAVVKGNVSCISKIVKSGSDLTKRNNQGVTPLELSKQLNSVHAFQRAMTTLGRFPDGRQKTTSLTTKNTKWAVFLIPTMMVYVALKTFDLLPWYTAGLLVIAELFGGHHVVSRVLTDGQPDVDGIKSPYLAGIVVASLLWVGYTWLTTLIGATSSLPMTNLAFGIAYILCCYNLARAITLDPGCVPLYEDTNHLKDVIEEAVSAGRFTPRDFCIYCMVRRPVRAKHCKVCSKCVARHDHHCPWIWNCVGVDNHRQFFLFTTTLVIGVCLFDRLALAYWSQLPTPSETSRELTCVFPQAICDASHADTFTFAIACWATLQLSWTVLVAASHAYQITRQLTTYELSNLGRFGYMGGRASNLNQQQQSDTGGCPREGGHHHRHNGAKVFKRLLALLGLDLYTKGKAAEGIRKSATERRSDKFNPFDAGIWRNCTDFWSRGKTLGVDYVSLYEVPEGGFQAALSSRRQDSVRDKKATRKGGRYEMVSVTEDV